MKAMGRRAAIVVLGLAAGSSAWAARLDPQAEFEQRVKKLGDTRNSQSWLLLADFCEKNLLFRRRAETLRKVLKLDPKNAQAHKREGWGQDFPTA